MYSISGPMTRIINWIEQQLNPTMATVLVSSPYTELRREITSPIPGSDESSINPP